MNYSHFLIIGFIFAAKIYAQNTCDEICSRRGSFKQNANFTGMKIAYFLVLHSRNIACIIGRWVMHNQTNFEVFAKSQGVPWILRRLGHMDKPVSLIVHDIHENPALSERFWHQLTEAHQTQASEWLLPPQINISDEDCATNEDPRQPNSLQSNKRLLNPLREAVDVEMAWSESCPGVLVERHTNLVQPSNSVRM